MRKSAYVLITGDFVKTGGMDRANHALASYLAAREHPVDLVGYRVDPDLLAFPNVRWRRVRKRFGSYFLSHPMLHRAASAVAGQVLAAGGRAVANGGTGCKVRDVNWVHYVHAAWPPAIGGSYSNRMLAGVRHRVAMRHEQKAMRAARLIIVNSQRTRRDLVERLGVDDARIRLVYLGVAADQFAPLDDAQRTARRERLGLPTDRPLAAFVGALGDRRKGFDTLYAAWEGLCRDSNWDADLAVIGSGGELPAWRRRAREACLGDRIHFLGFRNDVHELMPAFDAMIAPTRYEAYGLGVHEALCCGVPSVVSASAGVAERIPEALAPLLIDDPESVDELKARLVRWRGSMDAYRASTLALADELRQHTWDRMAAQMVELIERN